MTKSRSGWQARAIHNAYNARAKRNKQIAQLRAERIYDEFTPADIESRLSDLKTDFLARDAQRRAAA